MNIHPLRRMSLRDLAWFGIFERAYITTTIEDGQTVYAVHAANGTLLSRMPSLDTACLVVVEDYAMELASVH